MGKTNGPTVAVLVIDAVGIPTLEYLLDNYDGKVSLPTLSSMGLGNLLDRKFHDRITPTEFADFTHAIEQASASADSVIGHREMMGVIDPSQYELFSSGFPPQYISAFEEAVGKKTIFNKLAGGTEAIRLNREEHEKRDDHPLIVYASNCDAAAQVAANVKYYSPDALGIIANVMLYLARKMDVRVTRAISRPYESLPDGGFARLTKKRHDSVVPLPPGCFTLIDVLHDAGIYTVSVGKPAELVDTPSWDERIKYSELEKINKSLGINFVHPKQSDTNPYSIQGTIDALRAASQYDREKGTLVLINFVDTDSLWGHVPTKDLDFERTLRSVQEIDRWIPYFLSLMKNGDVFIVTADHGMRHTDLGYHNKEPVYFLAERIGMNMRDLRVRNAGTFATVGDVVAQVFGIQGEYAKKCNLGNFFN